MQSDDASTIEKIFTCGNSVICLLDISANQRCSFFEALSSVNHILLFQESPLEHIADKGPYAIEMTSDSLCALQRLCTSLNIRPVLAAHDNTFFDSLSYWRSLLVVHDERKTRLLFRFFDGDICARMLSVFDTAEFSLFLGPHAAIGAYGQVCEDPRPSWSLRERQDGSAFAASAKKPVSCWWTFKDRYWKAFEDRLPQIQAYSVSEYLFEYYPRQAGQKQADIPLEKYVLEQMKKAAEQGLDTLPDVKLYSACALLLGDGFRLVSWTGKKTLSLEDKRKMMQNFLQKIEAGHE